MAEATTKADVIARYADVPLRFTEYFKFTFWFAGTAPDGASISAGFGGNSDDIYRFEVKPDTVMTLTADPADVWRYWAVRDAARNLMAEGDTY